MGVSEILQEIKSLPMQQRWEILERTREMLDAEIPESFKQNMREIARGEVIELDEALEELEQPELVAKEFIRVNTNYTNCHESHERSFAEIRYPWTQIRVNS